MDYDDKIRQTDKFISTGGIPSQKFWQWGDDINNDGITPLDGIYLNKYDPMIF